MFYVDGMARVQYAEVVCKSALNRVQGMPFPWSLNPYRGCAHRCRYCYARTTHTYFGLDVRADFESRLFVKTNVAAVLAGELRRSTWRGESIAIGTATDPYQPAEGRYRLTRRCLEVLVAAENAATITTKGTLVVRDIDVLQDLTAVAGCGVNVSLITLDENLWRAFEPGTPPPRQRLRALERLAQAGVPCGLALAPILPRLTDSMPALEAVVQAAAEHGARWLWSGTLHFEPAVRDVFLDALERHQPRLLPDYVRVFGRPGGPAPARYAPRAYADAVGARVAELKARHGFTSGVPARIGTVQAPKAGGRLAQAPLPL